MAVPEYTKRAINNYRANHDYLNIVVDKGVKDRLKAAGLDNKTLAALILAELEKREGGGVPF